MKLLPEKFRKNGFDYSVIWNDGTHAIYRQTKPTVSIERFEVIEIQRHNGFTIGGVKLEPAESFPPSSQWGKLGWTCITKQDAFNKVDEWRAKQHGN